MLLTIAHEILSTQVSFRYHRAFSRLYNLHIKALFRLAMQCTGGDKQAAGEIVERTWIAACENVSAYSRRGRMRKWLVHLLVKCSRDYYHMHGHYMLIDNNFRELLASRLPIFKISSKIKGFEEALGLLPVGYRHVLMLHDIHGYKQGEISELLHITEGACIHLLHKARQALRQLSTEFNQANANHYRGWSESEIKILRTSYNSIVVPNELREQVMNQLYRKGLIVNNYPVHTFIKSIDQAFRWPSMLLQR